jgi:probable F420-dependent oxidoreductase
VTDGYLEFVLGLTYTPVEELVALSQHAQACGYDVVSVSDHLCFPASLSSQYPYSKSNSLPWSGDDPWGDPWSSIAAMAASTTDLCFMTNVFVLPLRDPFSVAKAVATCAVLSNDRVSIGVGVGWMREEFDLVGRCFGDRGARTNEMIEILRLLWSGKAVGYDGEFYSFEPVQMSPAPRKPVPVLVGGESSAALDRAARLGDGFVPTAHRMTTVVNLIAELERRRDECGRGSEPFRVVAVVTDAARVDHYAAMAKQGVTGMISVPWGYGAGKSQTLREKLDAMERYSETVIQPVRKAGVAARTPAH